MLHENSKMVKMLFKRKKLSWHWWLRPMILATQKAEIRRIELRSQPRQTVHKAIS
jgi:hypothetical protein